jgi:DNA-binding response OmpR family regulator
VDDDRSLIDVLTIALGEAGFDVAGASNGRLGWEAFQREEPNLVILDLLMPELDGLQLCKLIREDHQTPIIMLTSRGEEMDKVLGLEVGADDYMTKPFSTRELVARIQAALRRVNFVHQSSPESPEDTSVQKVGPLSLDRAKREARVGETPLTLTATEFDLLWVLSGDLSRVHTRQELIDRVYGEEIIVADRTVDTFIKRLRRKLSDADPNLNPIETIRSVGYRYCDS